MHTSILSLLTFLLLAGAGCVPSTQAPFDVQVPVTNGSEEGIVRTPEDQTEIYKEDTSIGLYKDWNRVVIKEIIAIHIPPTCIEDVGRETVVIVCPTDENPTPTPAMYITIHEGRINVLRWENMKWEGWDDTVASIQILTPLA
ncbi:TPA: hypothetical protein DEB00_03100, partial [Candidatus Uhrbacteria bacterium]|nr:hypothetical protein [Candidatus Uhrbacteria bacterium]